MVFDILAQDWACVQAERHLLELEVVLSTTLRNIRTRCRCERDFELTFGQLARGCCAPCCVFAFSMLAQPDWSNYLHWSSMHAR